MKTRIIQTRFWKDEYITSLPHKEKLAFLFLLTNETVNMTGVYQVYPQEIALWCGISQKEVINILEKFEQDKKIIYRNGWVKLKNHSKYQNYGKGKQKKAFEKELGQIPEYMLNQGVDTSIDTDIDTSIDTRHNTEYRNQKPKKKSKKEKYLEESEKIMTKYSSVTGRRAYSSASWLDNYIYWRDTGGFSHEQILKAISNWNSYQWFKGKDFDLTNFFRTNQNWIEKCLNAKSTSYDGFV